MSSRSNYYTITYDANGGIGAPSSQTEWGNVNTTISAVRPSKDGYEFLGWSSVKDGAVSYRPGDVYSAGISVTLYAVWRANTFTITYDANGGINAPAQQTKKYGEPLRLSTLIPNRTDYKFIGWGVSSASTTIAYRPGDSYLTDAPITLYAIWQLDYTEPRITEMTVDRCIQNGILSEEGMYARVMCSWETDKTPKSIVIKWKKTEESLYSSSVSLIVGTQKRGVVNEIIGNGNLSTEFNYDIRIEVTDAVRSNSDTRTLPSMEFMIDFFGEGLGMAFGMPARREGIDSAMIPHFASSLVGNIPIKENENLNEITIPGNYACDQNVSKTLINCPVKSGFKLEAGYAFNEKDYLYQEIKDFYSGKTYYRVCKLLDHFWSEWQTTQAGASSTLLWSGALTMTQQHSITLPSLISATEKGVILVFSLFENGQVTDWAFSSFFIPKDYVKKYEGKCMTFMLATDRFNIVGIKCLYIHDGKITGYSDNGLGPRTGSGITYENNKWVLREVYGV